MAAPPGLTLRPGALARQERLRVPKLLPADIPRVMVHQQHPPLRDGLLLAMALPRPPVNDDGLGGGAAIDQCPGVARLAQPLMDAVLTGQAPEARAARGPRLPLRQRPLRLTIPGHGWPGTAQFPKLLEDASDGVLHLAISDLFEPLLPGADEPDGDFPHDMTALDFGFKGLASALPHEAQLIFRHGALHAQHQAIIQLPWIIDAVIIDEQGLGQRTEIDHMMPVPVVAGSPGGFQGEDGADTPCAHRRQPWAKARALVASGPTPAHVFIDHDDTDTSQRPGLIGAGLWPPLPRGVGADLMAGGLADRDGGVTLERARVNLGAHGDPPRSGHGG